jgi:hypothetical protein
MAVPSLCPRRGFWLQAVFFAAGSVNVETAPIVAEMLGFKPELVMPHLRSRLGSL